MRLLVQEAFFMEKELIIVSFLQHSTNNLQKISRVDQISRTNQVISQPKLDIKNKTIYFVLLFYHLFILLKYSLFTPHCRRFLHEFLQFLKLQFYKNISRTFRLVLDYEFSWRSAVYASARTWSKREKHLVRFVSFAGPRQSEIQASKVELW